MGATASLERDDLAIEPGDQITTSLRIVNNGGVVDDFTFDVVGPCASWISVEPKSVSIMPDGEETVTIRFAPPRAPELAAGPAPYGVRVVSREDPGGSVVDEGTVTVGRFDQRAIELNPVTARCRRKATYELAIDNRGNAPIEVSLSAADSEDACRYRFREPVVRVAPGAAHITKVDVTPARTFWKGSPKTHQFHLVATTDEGAPDGLDGTLLQEPLLPPWTVKAALVVAALTVALFVLWKTVIEDAVESTARDAVEAPIEELNAKVEDLVPTTVATEESTPATTPPPVPAPGATPAEPPPTEEPVEPPVVTEPTYQTSYGNALDVQLGAGTTASPGAAATSTHTFGANFALTDVLLQNPGGDSGTVQIARDGEVLLTSALENFRDYDVHFVAPLMFASGQALTMTVTCDVPGPTNESGCAVSASFGGFSK